MLRWGSMSLLSRKRRSRCCIFILFTHIRLLAPDRACTHCLCLSRELRRRVSQGDDELEAIWFFLLQSGACVFVTAAGAYGSRISNRTLEQVEMHRELAIRLDGSDSGRFDVLTLARFTVEEINELAILLLPERITTSAGCVAPRGTALFVLLAKLAAPLRYTDMVGLLQQSPAWICQVYTTTLEFLYHNWAVYALGMSLHQWEDQFEVFSDAIGEMGPLKRAVGMLDATLRDIRRPSDTEEDGDLPQKVCYSGHKRKHGLKYQGIVLPNGIVPHMSGPWAGHRNDQGIVNSSGLHAHLADVLGTPLRATFPGAFIFFVSDQIFSPSTRTVQAPTATTSSRTADMLSHRES